MPIWYTKTYTETTKREAIQKMKLNKLFLASLVLGLCCLPIVCAEQQIPWLGFHDVVSGAHEATSDINVTFLNQWTQFLVDKGYTALTYDQLYAYLTGANTTPLPKRVVVLSFDDNYIGVYTYAYPRLSALGLKATNFVHTNYVGVVTSKDHCDWNELQQMEASGVITAQSHTKNHVDLTTVDAATRWEELTGSKAALEGNLSKTVNYLAYPYGHTNSTIISEAQSAGYLSAVLYNNQYATVSSPEFEVPRLQMGSTDTMTTFKTKVLYKPDMFVQNIAMSKATQGKNKYAKATVTIYDEDNAFVSGATVTVQWSGLVSGTSSGTTNGGGAVTLNSPATKSSGTITATVTNVVKSGWNYNSTRNVETSDSITV
jgi:peptidoglycan/xylan/chitin deacetylase (PgdA/CDA1 family)